MEKTNVTIETTVNAPVDKVWEMWNKAEHITKWNAASDDWHSPRAENDVRDGGKFNIRMEAKDGSFGFDFAGVYDKVITNELLEYTMEDDRKVSVVFTSEGGKTRVVETFETETENSVDMQRAGWQAILDNFRKYAESGVASA
jgi:uncharacterized protein YndB with AHSA1/START domain